MMVKKVLSKASFVMSDYNFKELGARLSGMDLANLASQGYEFHQSKRLPIYCPWNKNEEFLNFFNQAYVFGFPTYADGT